MVRRRWPTTNRAPGDVQRRMPVPTPPSRRPSWRGGSATGTRPRCERPTTATGGPYSLSRCWPSRRTTTQRTSRAWQRATFNPARADVGGRLAGSPRREIADRLPAPSPRGPQRAVVRLAVIDNMIQQQIRPSRACRLGTARSQSPAGAGSGYNNGGRSTVPHPPLTSSPSPPYPPSPPNPRSPRTWPCARPAMRNWHHCAIPSTSPAPPIPSPTPVRHRGYGTPSAANSPPHPGTCAESYLLKQLQRDACTPAFTVASITRREQSPIRQTPRHRSR